MIETSATTDPTPADGSASEYTLSALANLSASFIRPNGRALATCSTLRELLEVAAKHGLPDPGPAALALAYHRLSQPKKEEPEYVSGRRGLCGQLATLLRQHLLDGVMPESSDVELVTKALVIEHWNLWIGHCEAQDDDRHREMAKTFARELTELMF
jgi:hypothetical protein